VKHTTNYSTLRKDLLRITASALMFVILCIQGAQAFHDHTQSSRNSNQQDQSTIDVELPNCSICYYQSDKQGKQLNYTPECKFVFVSQETEKEVLLTISRIPNLSIPGFTNKGPPAI
jgi:ribonuclease HIII